MRRSFLTGAALGAPILISLVLMGCGRPVDEPDVTSSEGGGGAVASAGPQAELKPLPGKVDAVLRGKVTINGSPDVVSKDRELAAQMAQKADKGTCYDQAPGPERTQQQWVLDGQGGVGNAVVWIQPPEGYFFAVDLKDKTWLDVVELSQPHFAFKPHVSWVMPEIVDPNDPTKRLPSGQKFTVSNLAPVSHNTKWDSSNSPNSSGLGTLKANTAPQEVPLKGNNALVHFSCNIHPWMDAYVWVFNHPYAAVTDEHGNYEIKNVPAGSKVRITAWHELGPSKFSHFLTPDRIKGTEIELKDGENVQNFTLDLDTK